MVDSNRKLQWIEMLLKCIVSCVHQLLFTDWNFIFKLNSHHRESLGINMVWDAIVPAATAPLLHSHFYCVSCRSNGDLHGLKWKWDLRTCLAMQFHNWFVINACCGWTRAVTFSLSLAFVRIVRHFFVFFSICQVGIWNEGMSERTYRKKFINNIE